MIKNNKKEVLQMKKNKIIISVIINICIAITTLIMIILGYAGIKFTSGCESYEATGMPIFKFFTVQSNMLMGIVALIFAIKEIQLLKGKITQIPIQHYIAKMAATTAVGLTFLVVFAYLGPVSKGGLLALLQNSNLFLHLIIPVVSILTFILFERTSIIKRKHTIYGLVSTVLYAIYYVINLSFHIENGKVSPVYDWYKFVQNGIWTVIIVLPMMLLVTYIITLIIWKINNIKIKS